MSDNIKITEVTGQTIPVDMRLLVEENERLRSQLARAIEGLNKLAAWDDATANNKLERSGSYAYFDDPQTVRLVRDILTELKAAPDSK